MRPLILHGSQRHLKVLAFQPGQAMENLIPMVSEKPLFKNSLCFFKNLLNLFNELNIRKMGRRKIGKRIG